MLAPGRVGHGEVTIASRPLPRGAIDALAWGTPARARLVTMSVVMPDTSANPVVFERFRRDLGELWTEVAPLCHSAEDPADLAAALHAQDGTLRRVLPDLEALLAGWTHYDSSRRAILTGAVTYVTEDRPADAPTHPEATVPGAEEVVVDAAVRAFLRRR